MKTITTAAVFVIGLFLFSCDAGSSQSEKEKELLKKELELAQKELEVQKLAAEQEKNMEKQPEATIDPQSNPRTTVQLIFDAAKTGDFSLLSGLCPPDGSGDGDTRSICTIPTQNQAKKDEFKMYFSTGKIIGDPAIKGNTAKVKFTFGPGGTKEEEFEMVKIDDKWYIVSF